MSKESPLILVVDDEPDLAEYIAYFLLKSGFRVELATGGFEAISKLEQKNFDLIITDIRMPKGDGLSLIKSIRGKNKKLPIFCVTGFSEMSNTDILDLGANAVFEKPLDSKKIIKSVQEFLNV